MACTGFFGFETGDLNELSVAATGTAINSTVLNSPGGAYSVRISGGSVNANRMSIGTLHGSAEIWIKFAFQLENVSTPGANHAYRFTVADDTTQNLGGIDLVQRSTDGLFFLRTVNSTNTVIDTDADTFALSANTTYEYVLYRKVAASGGIVAVYDTDGNLLLQSTYDAAFNNPGGFTVTTPSTGSRAILIDDITFDNAAAFRKNARIIKRQFKTGTPTHDAFSTVGGGTKFGNISETPFSATLAIQSSSTTASEVQTALTNSFSSTETGAGSGTIDSDDTLIGARVAVVGKTSLTSSSGNAMDIRFIYASTEHTDNNTVGTTDTHRAGSVYAPTLTELNASEGGYGKRGSGAARQHTCEDAWVMAAYIPVTAAGKPTHFMHYQKLRRAA